jgi:hypothetical protein
VKGQYKGQDLNGQYRVVELFQKRAAVTGRNVDDWMMVSCFGVRLSSEARFRVMAAFAGKVKSSEFHIDGKYQDLGTVSVMAIFFANYRSSDQIVSLNKFTIG